MSELEERLNSILSDPHQMERIAAMAQSLMGGAPQSPPPPPSPSAGLFEGLDPAMLGRLTGALSRSGQSDSKRALLTAMKPYLSPRRQEKLERAMKLAKMIQVAEIAFGTMGGGGSAQI